MPTNLPNITIRPEISNDFKEIRNLIQDAFSNAEHSNHEEHNLVEKLRDSDAYIPELALVAIGKHKKILGHIMLTHISIDGKYPSLALAPISVLPQYQKQGIGSALMKEAHQRAANLGHSSIIVLGHKDYYPRFGYSLLKEYGIQLPFDVPEESCMAIELRPGALKGVRGTVIYPAAFE